MRPGFGVVEAVSNCNCGTGLIPLYAPLANKITVNSSVSLLL